MAETAGLTRDDLRAGVAAGVLSEAQAARLLTLAETRSGVRALGEDEPFELFRGFAEVFVSIGLVMLVGGLLMLSRLVAMPLVVAAFAALLCAALALYFTRVRRMVLPSVVLVTGFALAVLAATRLGQDWSLLRPALDLGLMHGAILIAALLAWYAVFRVPFTMFLIGLAGLGVVFSVTSTFVTGPGTTFLTDLFDLRGGSGLALGTLVFGLIAFAAAMSFDMSDPHRLGRRAASGFWLHLLAAPALVNTVALTFYNMQSAAGFALLALALLAVTALALVIDRRSFLTAGIGYFAVLLAFVLRAAESDLSWIGIILILGLFVTLVGAFWTGIRAALMRLLPEFPGKRRLPPYSE